jgi:hypothetical protein
MRLSHPKQTYFMPMCLGCKKVFKLLVKDCMRISFSMVDEKGNRSRVTHYKEKRFCPKCVAAMKADPIGFLKRMNCEPDDINNLAKKHGLKEGEGYDREQHT